MEVPSEQAVMTGKGVIIDSRPSHHFDTSTAAKQNIDHDNESVSVGAKSRTVYVALREPPHQLQTATVQTTQQQLPPMHGDNVITLESYSQVGHPSEGQNSMEQQEIDGSHLFLQEEILSHDGSGGEPKVIVQTLFPESGSSGELVSLSSPGVVSQPQNAHVKFLPSEPVPINQLTNSELVAGSEQVRHAMADEAANPPSPSNTTLPAIDSDEVMRIVALDQQHQTPQPLISLEPTPEQTFLLVSPQDDKVVTRPDDLRRERHLSDYEYSPQTGHFNMAGSAANTRSAQTPIREIVIGNVEDSSASLSSSPMSSRSGGSVSPPAATVVANKRKSNPSRPTRRNQPTHNNGRQDLGEPDGLVDQSASSQFRLLRGVPPGGRSGGGGRTRQLSAASSIESNSSFNSNHSAGGDAAPPSSSSKSSATNSKRKSKNPIPDMEKDDKYWKRRLKNNIAARRSREIKRMKEDELSRKADELEAKNEKLEKELEAARAENARLRAKLMNYEADDEICKLDDESFKNSSR